jgi:hypothetical protein
MKKGDNVIMLFHGFGAVSEEPQKVIAIRKNIVTLDTDEDPKKCKKFNTETGECINDDTMFGCFRTLKL